MNLILIEDFNMATINRGEFEEHKRNIENAGQNLTNTIADAGHDLKYSLSDAGSSIFHDGKKLANDLYQEGRQKVQAAEDNLKEYSEELTQKVKENPLASLMIAAGVGFLLSSLFKR